MGRTRDVTRLVPCARSATPGTSSSCLHHLMQADTATFRYWCKSLIASLENADCILLSLGWMAMVLKSTMLSAEDNPFSTRLMYATYSACFKWLTLPRSDRALMDLCNFRCLCTPSQMQLPMHEAGLDVIPKAVVARPFAALLSCILEPFAKVDSEYDDFGQYAYRVHTLPRRRMWPRSVTSVLPHGPEGTVRAFLRILATDIPPASRGEVYVALCRILRLCGPLVAPLLIRSSFFARHAIDVMRDLRLEPESHVQGKLDSDHNFEVITCIKDFVGLMSEIVGRSTSEAERVAFHSLAPASTLASYAHCIDIYGLAQTIVNAPSTRQHYQKHPLSWSSILVPIIRQFMLIGAKLCNDCPSAARAEISVAAKKLVLERLRSDTATKKLAEQFMFLMQHLEIRQRCGAPGCVKTRADGRLRCCTGCRRVMYCSRACQKAAWRHTIAHRDVCQAIPLLCLAMEIPEQGIFDFMKDFREGELRTDPTHEGLYQQVLDHFAKLTSYELKTSREGMPPI
jgi:hypothetical protein